MGIRMEVRRDLPGRVGLLFCHHNHHHVDHQQPGLGLEEGDWDCLVEYHRTAGATGGNQTISRHGQAILRERHVDMRGIHDPSLCTVFGLETRPCAREQAERCCLFEGP